ncbi:hypothetical protein ACA910_017983 [Epithemia clementina (nom. ined.)]
MYQWILHIVAALAAASSSSAFTVVCPTLSLSPPWSTTTTRRTRPTTTTTQLHETTSQQAEYGKSLALPDTYVKCGKCQTVYSLQESDLGDSGRGRRLECSVCGHSWYQSKDRLLTLRDGYQLLELPETDRERIQLNLKEGKEPGFTGDVKLYVGNISFDCHEDDLRNLFESVGPVGDVSLVRDEDGKNRGFGFVTMRTQEDGNLAMEKLDGASVRGRSIAVRESTN